MKKECDHVWVLGHNAVPCRLPEHSDDIHYGNGLFWKTSSPQDTLRKPSEQLELFDESR